MNSHAESVRRNNLWRVIHAAWILLAIVALGIFVASLPAYALSSIGAQTDIVYDAPPVFVRIITVVNTLASIAAAVTSLGLAFILFRRKPRDAMAMYVSFYLLAYGVVAAGPLGALEGSRSMTESLTILAEAILLTTPTITLFFIFPTGQFVPRWTRWVPVLSLVWIIAAFELIGHPPAAFDLWSLAGVLVSLFTWCLAAFYGLIYRYRRVSNLVERQQTKWVVFGLTSWFVYIAITMMPYLITQAAPRDTPQPMWALVLGPTWWLALNLLPLSLTIAVMRYHLFDIDILINRALVYGALTAVVVIVYVLIVGALGALFQSIGNLAVSLVATGIAAILFQPLRARLQRGVNRLMYGERDDPYAVLSRLGDRLKAAIAPDAVLPAIVETVAHALRLPYAAIELTADGDGPRSAAIYPPSAAGGPPPGVIRLPLVYQGGQIGVMALAPRAPNEPFTPAERRLLEDIADQAGVAVHNVQLTADLQHSRERLVTAREEERRRLRRDLHDGLGPALASLTLKLDAARNQLKRDPDTADRLLGELKAQTQTAIADIRRLVYDLRPPALDELGLVSAIREQAARYSTNGLSVTVEAPEVFPPLPAAVEVAAYRIASEALTNVVNHAGARHCAVRFSIDDALTLEIVDDGAGLAADARSGVGLSSMRERAAELGGTCIVENLASGGVQVMAKLPING